MIIQKEKINWGKVVFWAFLLGTIILACISCNPVARVISNPKHYKAITEHVISSGACVNDSVYISDTTIILDTLNVIETVSDTVRIGDSVWIDRVEYRTITKTVTIRDTTIVTDRAKENLLQNKLIDKTGEVLKKSEELEQSKAETKEARKERNKWRLYFFLLLAAFGVWIFRKPILKLISPIKL